jgi:cytosine/creatinine deaminase
MSDSEHGSSGVLPYKKHDVVSVSQLDDMVFAVQQAALHRGMIPIAGVISRPLDDKKHEILGFGNNRLADGIPGIHGETGAIIHMGRIETGYADLVCTSSLSPCSFCQCTLARQLGIRTIRILDDENYRPNKEDYRKAGITPEIVPDSRIEATFKTWVNDDRYKVLWNRDIGIATGLKKAPLTLTAAQMAAGMDRAERLALRAETLGEAPIGAIILDNLGVVVGSGHAGIRAGNDASLVAAMAAWRAVGSRDDWGRHTLILTAGPDYIALGMFKIFNFGQLIVGSDRVFAGQLQAVRDLGKPVSVRQTATQADAALKAWLANNSPAHAREYFGADWEKV